MSADETYDAGDAEKVGKARRKTQTAEEKLGAALDVVASTPQGRYFLWWILQQAGIYVPKGYSDSIAAMSYFAGARDLGVAVQERLMRAAPEALLRMIKENGTADG